MRSGRGATLARASPMAVAMNAGPDHATPRPAGLIVATEPPMHPPLHQLARRLAWPCLIGPSRKRVLRCVRERARIVVVQLHPDAAADEALELVETLHHYWVPCAVVAALAGGGVDLERRVRQAGATCLVGPPVREPALGRAIDALSGVGRWHPGRGVPDAEDDHPPREGRGRPPPASELRRGCR